MKKTTLNCKAVFKRTIPVFWTVFFVCITSISFAQEKDKINNTRQPNSKVENNNGPSKLQKPEGSNFLRFANKVDDTWDSLIRKFRFWFGSQKPLMIQPYRGFGNHDYIFLMGRVLEDKNIPESADSASTRENFSAMIKRFNSNEYPHATLNADVNGTLVEIKADKEGYFDLEYPIAESLDHDTIWHTINLKLLEPGYHNVFARGKILIPPPESKIGIISDIDDTVLQSSATNFIKMLHLSFFNNAKTRLPFEGVAAFYRALHEGTDKSSSNPLFYVSSSPWNLYDALEDFFEYQNIPAGPFILRDLGIDENKFIRSGHGDHKIVQIEKVLRTYPNMKFILIGDSGQKDPEIFTQVVRDYKERVLCIYIRDVTDAKREAAVQLLSEEVAKSGIELVFTKNSYDAAVHAAKMGYIKEEALPGIEINKIMDETPSAN